jgi:hypothetical protein
MVSVLLSAMKFDQNACPNQKRIGGSRQAVRQMIPIYAYLIELI